MGIALFLTAVYAGLRDYEGFHGIPYLAITAGILALCAGDLEAALYRRVRWAAWALGGALSAALLVSFVIWGGYNLLYPQILLNRTLRSDARILDLLTEPEEEVHFCDTSVFEMDLMDLELIPQDACYAASTPWYYDMWKDRLMASIQALPPVVMYKPEERTWGIMTMEHAAEYDAFIQAHYTFLPQSENIWVSEAFLPEAQKRLAENGYGDYIIANCTEIPENTPAKYSPGQSVQFSFTADAARLTAVRLCASRYYQRSSPMLRIQIREAGSGTVIAEAKMTADMIADTFFSRCPIQAELTPGMAYFLDITVEEIGGKGDMEFYFTPGGELAAAIEYAAGNQEKD